MTFTGYVLQLPLNMQETKVETDKRLLSRRGFLRLSALTTASLLASGCTTSRPESPTPPVIRTDSTSRPGPTVAVSTGVPTSTATPGGVEIGKEFLHGGRSTPSQPETSPPLSPNQQLVVEAKRGEQITLANPDIRYLVRFPGSIYLAVPTEDSQEYAVIENAGCIFDTYKDNNLLGPPIPTQQFSLIGSGVWQPNQPLEELKASIFLPYATGTVPVLTAQGITYQGQPIDCPKDSAFDEESRRAAAQAAGHLLKPLDSSFLEGFREN